MATLSSIFGTDVEEIEPMAIPEPLGDYGLDTNPSPYGTLQLKEYPFYALGDAPEAGMGETAKNAGRRVGFNIRQHPFDMYPEGVNYMDSGLDDLNLMFPTAADIPYDPFYLGNIAQQAKNMDPNAFDPNWKNKIHNPKVLTPIEKAIADQTSWKLGEGINELFLADPVSNAGGGMTGGPLSRPAISRQDTQREKAAAELAAAKAAAAREARKQAGRVNRAVREAGGGMDIPRSYSPPTRSAPVVTRSAPVVTGSPHKSIWGPGSSYI